MARRRGVAVRHAGADAEVQTRRTAKWVLGRAGTTGKMRVYTMFTMPVAPSPTPVALQWCKSLNRSELTHRLQGIARSFNRVFHNFCGKTSAREAPPRPTETAEPEPRAADGAWNLPQQLSHTITFT